MEEEVEGIPYHHQLADVKVRESGHTICFQFQLQPKTGAIFNRPLLIVVLEYTEDY